MRAAPQGIDGAALGGRHERGTGIVSDALLRPDLEGGDEGILGEFFSNADVASDASDGGDEASRLDFPNGVDCFGHIGFGHIGSSDIAMQPRLRRSGGSKPSAAF